MLPPASVLRKYFGIRSSWSAAGCAKRSHGRKRKDLPPLLCEPPNPLLRNPQKPLLRKPQKPLFRKPQKPLLRNPQKPLPLDPQNRLLRGDGDPLVGKMTAIRSHIFEMMTPSLILGAPKDHP